MVSVSIFLSFFLLDMGWARYIEILFFSRFRLRGVFFSLCYTYFVGVDLFSYLSNRLSVYLLYALDHWNQGSYADFYFVNGLQTVEINYVD